MATLLTLEREKSVFTFHNEEWHNITKLHTSLQIIQPKPCS